MNQQTDNAIAKLQQLIPVSAVIHKSTIDYGIDALLAGVEREQVKDKRIAMLEARLKETETHYVDLCIRVDSLIGIEGVPERQAMALETLQSAL